MSKISILFGVLTLAVNHGVLAQDLAAVVPKNNLAEVAPKNVKVTIDNEHVRVMEVTLKPGEKLPAHGHPVHLALVKSGGKLRVVDNGKIANYDSKPGDAFWSDCVTSHAGENVGKTTIAWSEVEFKNLPCKPAD